MTDGAVTQSLAEQNVKVLPPRDGRQVRRVMFGQTPKILAVVVRIVEVVVHQPPGLGVHLPPFRGGVDLQLDAAEV